MARRETDREDLIREATALAQRAEWAIDGWTDTVVVGFRATGALSVYFGADPVYQFDVEGRLRRVYQEGSLYRSHGTRLARLDRDRTENETVLRRSDLEGEALVGFLRKVENRLKSLSDAINGGKVRMVEQVPASYDLRPRVAAMLKAVLKQSLQLSPAIPTRKA